MAKVFQHFAKMAKFRLVTLDMSSLVEGDEGLYQPKW